MFKSNDEADFTLSNEDDPFLKTNYKITYKCTNEMYIKELFYLSKNVYFCPTGQKTWVHSAAAKKHFQVLSLPQLMTGQ